jgi:hypothetical protein
VELGLNVRLLCRGQEYHLVEMPCRSTENGVLQVGASQYMAALIIGFVNSATIQVTHPGNA